MAADTMLMLCHYFIYAAMPIFSLLDYGRHIFLLLRHAAAMAATRFRHAAMPCRHFSLSITLLTGVGTE